MSALFITATGTEIGKTLITAALTFQLRKKGEKVLALKPVISGFSEEEDNDTTLLMKIQEIQDPDKISPWRYRDAISPNMAAEKEGKTIEPDALTGFCRDQIKNKECVLIEGIGGAFVPLGKGFLVADWIKALKIPALIVAGSYLGTLSHTLSCYEGLRIRGIPIRAVIVTQSEEEPVPLEDTVSSLEEELPDIPVHSLERIDGEKPWEKAPDLTFLLED